jgi:hypothetical protein
MERLGWWLCAGLAKLGGFESDGAGDALMSDDAVDDPADMLFGGVLRESRIAYPLAMDAWQAVGEHLFEEQEDGVSVRYMHGNDRDRWVDVYFYPAGTLSSAQFLQAAQAEADLIREAHLQAGYMDFDMGRLRSFSFADGDGRTLDGCALDLAYTVDDVRYSSAMTLLLDRLYFVKTRYSIEESKLSRREAREQLQAFMARLQPRLAIVNTGDGAGSLPGQLAGLASDASQCGEAADVRPGMRELRLEYRRPHADPLPVPGTRTAELSVG